MMGEKEARYKSVKQETMETNRSSTVDQSEKHEHGLDHRKRKSITDHAFDTLFKEKRKSIPAADEELERPKRLLEVGNKRNRVRDTVSFAMGTATSICAPDAVSSSASEGERRDSEENRAAFSKRLREDRDPVKKEYCSCDGTDTTVLHNSLVNKSWNGASLMEDRVGSKASENRPLNSSCKENEANLIDSELEQSKREKETENKLKMVQWCCENRMSKLVEKQREEIQEFNSMWEQKRVALEKNHNVASVRIYSEHTHPVRTIKLEILDKEFDNKMEQYKQQKEKSLKEFEEKQLASRNEESQKAANWLRQAKSNANKERVHTELPLHGSQNGNQVGHSGASENGPPGRPENVVPAVGAVKKELSIDEVQSISGTSSSGKAQSINERTLDNRIELLKRLDGPIDASDRIISEVPRDIDPADLGTDRGDQIDSNAPNVVKKRNDQSNSFIRSNLSAIGEKCLVEASPLKGNNRNNQLNSEQERDSSSILSGKEQLKEPQNTRTIESISKAIKKVKKICDKRMRRLVQRHEKEIKEFNKLWDQNWLILEKSHKEVSAGNNSIQRFSGRIEKLDAWNSELANKMKEDYKHQKEMFLKDLEQTQLAEINEERKKAAHWNTELNEELKKAAHGISELKSLDSQDRANGERSWVEAIKNETVVANTTSENDSVIISFNEVPVNRVELSNSNGETDSSSGSANRLFGRPRDPENQASDDVCTLSRAEATAHDTLKDHDAFAVLGIENSEKENYGENLICSNLLNIQNDYITAEKVKVPPESSDVAQLDQAKHKDLLIEGANSVKSVDCDETIALTSPHSCSKKSSSDGKGSTEETEGILTKQGETAVEKVVGFELIERETEGMEESSEKISIGFNAVRKVSDGAISIISGNSPSCEQSLEICSLDQPVVSAICDLPLPPNLETQNKFSQPLSCNVSRDENGQNCQKLLLQVEVLSPEVRSTVPPIMENQTDLHQATGLVHESPSGEGTNLSDCGAEKIGGDLEQPHPLLISESPLGPTRIEGANGVGSSNCDETIAFTSPNSCLKKLSSDGKSVEQAEGVLTKQGETAPTEEGVGFEPIEREIEGVEESNEKISHGFNAVRKEYDGPNCIIPGNSPSRGQSLEICSPDQPVVSAICDLPVPHNLETQNKFSQPLSCNVSRDENGQSCQKSSLQVEVLSPEVVSTVPPVVENQTNLHQSTRLVLETPSGGRTNLPHYTDPPLHVAEDRSDFSHCGVERIGRDLERPHPLLVSESPLGPTPEKSSSQDAVILPQVGELTVYTLIHSILQSEPNLSCQDYNDYDQISSWIVTFFQNESEKISNEIEQVTKNREDMNSRLESECAKEIEERIAKIKSKYKSNLQDVETNCLLKTKENETMQNKVIANEKLSDAFRSTHLNPSSLMTMRMQQVVNSSFLQLLHQLPPLGLVPKPFPMAASPSSSPQVAVRAPRLQVSHQSAGHFSTRPTRPLTITSITPVAGSTVVRSNMRAPAPHIRHFRPSAQTTLPATTPPSRPLWSQRPQSIYPKTSPSVASPSSWSALPYMGPRSQHALGNLAGISHSPPLGSSWPPPPPPPPPPTPQPPPSTPQPPPQPPFSTDFPGFQSPHCSSLPVSTSQFSLRHRQQAETARASTSTPIFTDLSALRFLVDMDNL